LKKKKEIGKQVKTPCSFFPFCSSLLQPSPSIMERGQRPVLLFPIFPILLHLIFIIIIILISKIFAFFLLFSQSCQKMAAETTEVEGIVAVVEILLGVTVIVIVMGGRIEVQGTTQIIAEYNQSLFQHFF